MPTHKDFQAGAFSGLLAAIMIVALSVMAFNALTSAREPPMRVADLSIPIPNLPIPGVIPSGDG
jgi:hypothetical protein